LWERREDGWFAHVAYVIDAGAAMVVLWLPSELVRPAVH
jgi:hypothetical protein